MENVWNLFVGDLEYSVQDSDLWDAFSHYSSLASARVLRDPVTEKSKGYGFVSFSLESEALDALKEMNKTLLRNREIRVNWAVQKTSQKSNISYEKISGSTPLHNSTVYIGNLPDSETIFDDLMEKFMFYGYVLDLKIFKGFAFAKMDTHHSATFAILNLNGYCMDGSILKVSWAKEKFPWQNYMVTPFMMPYPIMFNNPPIAYAPYPNNYTVNNPMPEGNNEDKENNPSQF